MLGLTPVLMCNGVCTRCMVAGFLGNSQRMKYTIIGDTVNTAAQVSVFKVLGKTNWTET